MPIPARKSFCIKALAKKVIRFIKMKDLEKSQPFTVTVNQPSIGVLTTLVAENEVSEKKTPCWY